MIAFLVYTGNGAGALDSEGENGTGVDTGSLQVGSNPIGP